MEGTQFKILRIFRLYSCCHSFIGVLSRENMLEMDYRLLLTQNGVENLHDFELKIEKQMKHGVYMAALHIKPTSL